MGTVGSSNGITQFDSASALTGSTVNGALFGSLSGVTVGHRRYVTANYSNGLSQNIYQIPLATFANPDGLTAVSGTAYTASTASGGATLNAPNTDGTGTIESSMLEGSTVDIDTEFYRSDHNAKRLFRRGTYHHHGRPDVADSRSDSDAIGE